MGCVQLLMFERIAKKENPSVKNYSTMSEEQKKSVKKIGWKIAKGLLVLVGLAFLDHFFVRGNSI